MRYLCALVVLLASGCALLRQADVVDRIEDLAGQVCVEGDEVSVCLAKCQAAAEGAGGAASSAGGGPP